MTTFTLPESYRAYLKDAAVRSAVDYMLNTKKLEVPADLEWERLPDFHGAVLAAHQVQCDYATALHGLWAEIWQRALDECSFADSLNPLPFNEQQALSTHPCDTVSLWEGPLERGYDTSEHKLGLGVTSDFRQVWLAVWLLDGKGKELTKTLADGGDWDLEQYYSGYLYSSEQLAPISDGSIALEPLNHAANRALQHIGRVIGMPEPR